MTSYVYDRPRTRSAIDASDDQLIRLLAVDLLGRSLWYENGWQVRDASGQWLSGHQASALRDQLIYAATQGHLALGEVRYTTLAHNTGMTNRNRELLIRLRDYQLYREVPRPEDLPES